MESYTCLDCRYRFKAEKKPKACPWCGKSSNIIKEKSAEDIVDEIKKLAE